MEGKGKRTVETGELKLSKKYVAPEIKEDFQKGYVLNGNNNYYFDYVNERRLGSPTHSSVISNYIKLIFGQGLFDRNNNLIKQYLSTVELKKIIDDYYSQGMAYVEIIRRRDGELARLEHMPVKDIAPFTKNERNKIEAYVYSKDWSRQAYNDLELIPAFNYGDGKENELFCIRDYQYGQDYFALPKFQSVLQYAELEEEISNFSINHIHKGLAFGYIINIPNSSELSKEEKRVIKHKTLQALAGSKNAGATVFNFMTSDGDKIEVEVIQQNSAHKQWEALREQARDQIIVGHEVVSPLLFGINRGAGLSSTSDEMEEAEEQTMRRVIAPLQQTPVDAFETIFAKFGIITDLYFRPLSFKKETQLSKQPSIDDDEFVDELISKGENINLDEYDLISQSDVDYDNEDDIITKIRALNGDKLAVSTGVARPNSKSNQDSDNIVIRYKYVGPKEDSNSRPFCFKMTKQDKVYRKEDILQMDNKAVNPGWGPRGANTYSIWLYKGGGNCHHKWNRQIYLKKGVGVDVRNPLAEIISTTKARSKGYKVPTNENKVSIAPRRMENNGFLDPQ